MSDVDVNSVMERLYKALGVKPDQYFVGTVYINNYDYFEIKEPHLPGDRSNLMIIPADLDEIRYAGNALTSIRIRKEERKYIYRDDAIHDGDVVQFRLFPELKDGNLFLNAGQISVLSEKEWRELDQQCSIIKDTKNKLDEIINHKEEILKEIDELKKRKYSIGNC